MDLDAFVTEHRGEWERLRRLSSRRARRLSPEQVDELVALYQRAATHLSIVRSRSGDPALVAWLSQVVLRGRAALTPSRGFTWAGVVRFLTTSFPGEVWRAAPWWIGVAVAFSTLAGIRMAVVAAAPERYLPPAEIDRIVNEAFEAYYSTYQPQNFAALVWTNNTFVAALCLAAGVLIVPTLLVLWHNLENLGVLGGIMIANDRTDVFFGLLLIHGLLELTAVFVAAGVGLRIGWAWIAPGPSDSAPRGGAAGPIRHGGGARAWAGATGQRRDRGVRHSGTAPDRAPADDRRHGVARLPGLRGLVRPEGGSLWTACGRGSAGAARHRPGQ